MNPRADLIVRDDAGDPVFVVEVKNRQGLSAEIATQLRRNLVVHGLLRSARFFLLVSQDRGYLWAEDARDLPNAPPRIEFPMSGVVRRYLPERSSDERLRGMELELVILQWLTELTRAAGADVDVNAEPERSLAQVGLLDVLQGGTVLAQSPA